MISIIVTSFNEPQTIGKAIESFLIQDMKNYELIISAPDEATLNVARKYMKEHRQIKIFKDPGKGKSFALNLLLKKVKGKIIILSDGDVFVSPNSVNEILEKFKDSKVGCVTGKVLSVDSRKNLFGYWSHVLCYSAHKLRQKRFQKNEFLECSGYLWAFRNKIIKQFPKDVAEDTIVPILFYKKNFKISYAEKAEVYVKFPNNLTDFVKQKKRTIAGHEILNKYFKKREIPRMKTFFNEIAGSFTVLLYPKTIKEIFFTFSLFPIRLYIWLLTFYKDKIKNQKYTDAWERVESTK